MRGHLRPTVPIDLMFGELQLRLPDRYKRSEDQHSPGKTKEELERMRKKYEDELVEYEAAEAARLPNGPLGLKEFFQVSLSPTAERFVKYVLRGAASEAND